MLHQLDGSPINLGENRRVRQEIMSAPLETYTAVEACHAVRELSDQPYVMRDQHHGYPVITVQMLKCIIELCGGSCVHATGGFVEDQQLRVARKRLSQQYSL
jgi:hypothetical protein